MQNIIKISTKLKTLNKKLYIVWGFCRNKILWVDNIWGDIDLVTDATPDEMMKVLNIVGEVGKKYWTCIVSEWLETFEITTFRKDIWTINNRKPASVVFTDSLEEDSKRRDLTCNAIYFDVENEVFIDPVWWIEDIKNNVIKFVWNVEERIEEDALRILRFVRFKNKYWFSLSTEGFSPLYILKSKSYLLKNISVERIRQELDKILLLKNNIEGLQDLKNIDFFKHIIPEIEKFNFLNNIDNTIFDTLKKQDKLIIYYTILFNKNICSEVFQKNISTRLKFTNIQKKEIYWLIKNNAKLFVIPKMEVLKARKLMNNPLFEKLLIIWEINSIDKNSLKYKKINEIKNIYSEFKKIIKTKIFLTGEDIMRKYPELEWRKIWEKLEMLNDEIMVKD